MVTQAQHNLAKLPHTFQFEIIDIQSIPYAAGKFDTVIANHCLYHVPDRGKAFAEITRVLSPNGVFYGTTIGDIHMQELSELVANYDHTLEDIFHNQQNDFTLETGVAALKHILSMSQSAVTQTNCMSAMLRPW